VYNLIINFKIQNIQKNQKNLPEIGVAACSKKTCRKLEWRHVAKKLAGNWSGGM
jgi:3-methyladenine DNA glycosylase AlkD